MLTGLRSGRLLVEATSARPGRASRSSRAIRAKDRMGSPLIQRVPARIRKLHCRGFGSACHGVGDIARTLQRIDACGNSLCQKGDYPMNSRCKVLCVLAVIMVAAFPASGDEIKGVIVR